MKFKCNNTEYEIKEVDNIELSESLIGQTRFQEKTILLKKLDQDLMIKTLKHELTHVWLYEYGHSQDDNATYDYEDICEIVACSNDFINEVVQDYLGIEALYLCDKEKNTECDKRNCDVCMTTTNIEFAKKKGR